MSASPDVQAPNHAPLDTPEGEAVPPVNGDQLRGVMRRLASPVTVVTASAGGEARGATIGSFTSVSLDPPLVSFNVQRETAFFETLSAADAFVVHLLTDEHADLANHFALPDLTSAAQFDGIAHDRPQAEAPPVLHGPFAALHCTPFAVHDAGDHVLFLGHVRRVDGGNDGAPLLYFDRSYRAVGDEV